MGQQEKEIGQKATSEHDVEQALHTEDQEMEKQHAELATHDIEVKATRKQDSQLVSNPTAEQNNRLAGDPDSRLNTGDPARQENAEVARELTEKAEVARKSAENAEVARESAENAEVARNIPRYNNAGITDSNTVNPQRKWRVGTVSMGLSLIMLGLLIFMQQTTHFELLEPLSIWWPLILVLLGLELLCYLLFNKQSRLRYDMLSVFFIGVLGSVAIVLTIFTSLGLTDEFRTSMYQESQSYTMPEWQESVPAHIEKIVIFTGNNRVMIDEVDSAQLQIIGTYRTQTDRSSERQQLLKDDIATTSMVGNVIYVHMKNMQRVNRLFNSNTTSLNATITVPADVEWQVQGHYTSLVTAD